MSIQIQCSAFSHEGEIPRKYSVEGENINPPLEFLNIPRGAQTLALLVDDPDVPKTIRPDGLWTHWMIWNMPVTTIGMVEGGVPNGVLGKNGRGIHAYGGPNPPDGWHRYFFRLYALDCSLALDPETTDRTTFLEAIDGHVIESAELMGRYCREDMR